MELDSTNVDQLEGEWDEVLFVSLDRNATTT